MEALEVDGREGVLRNVFSYISYLGEDDAEGEDLAEASEDGDADGGAEEEEEETPVEVDDSEGGIAGELVEDGEGLVAGEVHVDLDGRPIVGGVVGHILLAGVSDLVDECVSGANVLGATDFG